MPPQTASNLAQRVVMIIFLSSSSPIACSKAFPLTFFRRFCLFFFFSSFSALVSCLPMTYSLSNTSAYSGSHIILWNCAAIASPMPKTSSIKSCPSCLASFCKLSPKQLSASPMADSSCGGRVAVS